MLHSVRTSLVVCCALATLARPTSAPAETPPANARAEQLVQATVYTARISAGVQATPAEMEQIARQKGSIEVIDFVVSGDPAAPDTRLLLRLGEPGLAFPGFSMGLRKALDDAIASGLFKPGQQARTFRSADPASPESIECALPEKPGDAFTATVKSNDTVRMRIRQYELPLGPNGAPWPSSIQVTVPGKGAIVQLFDYGPSPALPVPKRGVWGVSDLDETGSVPSRASAPRGTDSVSFTANWGWSTGWDSGYVPPGSPVLVRIGFGGGLAIDGDASGNFSMSGDPNLCVGSGSSSVCEDIGIEVIAEACVDFYIIDPICFDIPYVPNFDLRTQCCDTCNSFLLDYSCCCSDTIQRQQIWCFDLVPVPLITVGGCAEASMSTDVCLACDSMTTSAGSFTYEGQCRNVSADCDYHSTINYNDYTTLAATVHLYPALVACLDIWPYPCLDFAVWDFAWTMFQGSVNLSFSSSSLDFYDLGECSSNGDCNDGDPCTNDWCDSDCNCHNDFVGECRSNGECNDGDPCTNDWCDSNCNCHNDFVGECRSNGECNDGDPCTNDWCDSNCNCHHDFVGECRSNGECNDGDPCTNDWCDSSCNCHHDVVSSCCGNNACEAPGEHCNNCPQDCDAVCPNGVCENEGQCGEDSATCPQDCGGCGDGVCQGSENCNTCPQDCDAVCPNGVCENEGQCGEDSATCPQDCGGCGDGVCQVSENCNTCPQDCDAVCPNGVCENEDQCGEDSATCPQDCGGCLLYDMNGDGFISIIGDVPFFVNCVYFGQCDCPCDSSCMAPGDCNGDGFLSIIGDVPCFVECVYFGNCGP